MLKTKFKIAYTSNALIPSLSANSLQTMKMCEAFSLSGYDVYLMIPEISHKIDINEYNYYNVKKNFEIIRLYYPNFKGKNIIFGINEALTIKKIKPDLVYGRCIIGCTYAALMGYPVIFETHVPVWKNSNLASIFFKILVSTKNLKKIVVISNELKQYYIKHTKISYKLFLVAHSGASEINIKHKNSTYYWQGRSNRFNVGYVGHLYQGKGIEIIEKISKIITDIDFHIIGGNPDEIRFWRNRMTSPNVFFHGFLIQKQLANIFQFLDICLLPNQKSVSTSIYKRKNQVDIGKFTSPMKLFEYMANAKAIIASDFPQLREVLNDYNSVLVPHDDIAKWVKAIKQLQQNEAFRKQIAKKAYIDFLTKYSWNARVKYILNNSNIK